MVHTTRPKPGQMILVGCQKRYVAQVTHGQGNLQAGVTGKYIRPITHIVNRGAGGACGNQNVKSLFHQSLS